MIYWNGLASPESVWRVRGWVSQCVGGCSEGPMCDGCWLCSCVNPKLCFCLLNWWGKKTGSWPSCALKAPEQEAVRSTKRCLCLQRLQWPISDTNACPYWKKPERCCITPFLLVGTVPLNVQSCIKQPQSAQMMLCVSFWTHDRDMILIFVAILMYDDIVLT